MGEDLKNNWKKVGKDFASLGTDLGKSIIKSVKAGVSAAAKWAEEEMSEKNNEEPEAKTEDPKTEETTVEEPKAEEPKAEE